MFSVAANGSHPNASSRRATIIAKHKESRPESRRTKLSDNGASCLCRSVATCVNWDITAALTVILTPHYLSWTFTARHEFLQPGMNYLPFLMVLMDISANQRKSIPNCVKLTTTGFRVSRARWYHSRKLLVIWWSWLNEDLPLTVNCWAISLTYHGAVRGINRDHDEIDFRQKHHDR